MQVLPVLVQALFGCAAGAMVVPGSASFAMQSGFCWRGLFGAAVRVLLWVLVGVLVLVLCCCGCRSGCCLVCSTCCGVVMLLFLFLRGGGEGEFLPNKQGASPSFCCGRKRFALKQESEVADARRNPGELRCATWGACNEKLNQSGSLELFHWASGFSRTSMGGFGLLFRGPSKWHRFSGCSECQKQEPHPTMAGTAQFTRNKIH